MKHLLRTFRSFTASQKLMATVLLSLAFAGSALAGHGVYIKAKAELSQILLARSFEALLAGDANARPWPWADFTLTARIEAPRLQESAIVLSGVSGEAMAFGPAHMVATPLPGREGTSVIAAHRDTHFAWLKDVRKGDEIRVTGADGKVLTFAVTGSRIARWDQSGVNAQALGKHLDLVTCWPFDSKFHGDLRYILETEMKATVASR